MLYGCKTSTLENSLEKKLGGRYLRLLQVTLRISWRKHVFNTVLYSVLPKISDMIRRLRFAGHCFRRSVEVIVDLVLWEPRHGRRRTTMTFVNKLAKNCVMEIKGLARARREGVWAYVVAATISRHNKMST